MSNALVHERELVVGNVVWQETDYFFQSKIKLLILAEWELYPVYYIIQHTS